MILLNRFGSEFTAVFMQLFILIIVEFILSRTSCLSIVLFLCLEVGSV